MKQVLITGIGSGIGEATCHQFLKEGYSVIGILRNQNHLSKLKKNFGSLFNNLTPIYADLESSSFVETVWGQLADYKVDYLNCIVNIAGVLDTTQIDNVSVQQIEKVMRVNFVNPTMLISKLKPLLLTANSANIINITSMSGFLGSVRFPGLSIYGASKAALGSLSESLSVEFADHNIHINA
ncbi:MAG: SDR family NAD(P)-dependent oxidoreductase, partial [Salibacteraceae bacterium]